VRVPPGGSVLKVIFGVCCSAESRKQVKENMDGKDILTVYGENITEIDSEQARTESWSENLEITTETTSLVRRSKQQSRIKEKYSKMTAKEVYELWELVPIFLCFPSF